MLGSLPRSLSVRLLTVLQLTRMALVYTAVSDGWCALLLRARWTAGPGGDVAAAFSYAAAVAVAAVAVGLYGFGMSLNDIIDRRRDALTAAGRPLPSGRIGVRSAHLICAALAAVALAGGLYLALAVPDGAASLLVLGGTMGLITFYDSAGKYLVAPGLITLGLIRFFHAAVAAPMLPVVWHPLLLLNHVVLLSAVAYAWEAKRPTLTVRHWLGVVGGLLAVDTALLGLVTYRRAAYLFDHPTGPFDWSAWASALAVRPGLAVAGGLAAGFVGVAWLVRRHFADARAAGRQLMLVGLLWLILYDAAFALVYVGPRPAAVLLGLLPAAYLSVRLMRAWSAVLDLSQKPQYQRAR